jgi:hypothetical protein
LNIAQYFPKEKFNIAGKMRGFYHELSTYFHNRKRTTWYDCCPTKTGKNNVAKDIANAIAANHQSLPNCLLIDERPEEVTDMQRSVRGEVIASTLIANHNNVKIANIV